MKTLFVSYFVARKSAVYLSATHFVVRPPKILQKLFTCILRWYFLSSRFDAFSCRRDLKCIFSLLFTVEKVLIYSASCKVAWNYNCRTFESRNLPRGWVNGKIFYCACFSTSNNLKTFTLKTTVESDLLNFVSRRYFDETFLN